MSLDHAIIRLDHAAICAFLYREARLLDDQQWDDWLACYAPPARRVSRATTSRCPPKRTPPSTIRPRCAACGWS